MTGKVLVLAATGTIGSKVVQGLVNRGERVKAASRSGSAVGGAQGVSLDLANPASLDAALADVDRVFAIVPAGYLDPVGLLAPVFDTAEARRIKIVLMTVMGVDADENNPYRKLERRLENSGLPHAIIRPNWFADNFHTYWREGLRHGVIGLPAASGKTSFIDTRDIADSAVAALTNPAFDGQAFNLTGPQALGYAEAAEILGSVAGKAITYQPVDDDSFIAMLTGAGVPEAYARFLAAIFHPVREGWTATITGDVEKLTGHAPRSLQTYASDHRADLVD
nr:SDR family oxidoreductase [uncultured Gellertiella sp.]